MFYEYHMFDDEQLKIIHHIDRLKKDGLIRLHLHKNIEILLMISGSAEVTSDNDVNTISSGQMAIIPPNRLHKITAISDKCVYYCLIIDHSVYENWFSPQEMRFPLTCENTEIADLYRQIFTAVETKVAYYRQETQALILLMLSKIFRESPDEHPRQNEHNRKKLDMVRGAIEYMYKNFNTDISVDDLCSEIGFSKYYFCRCFKEITGQTPLWHLNYIRCQSAKAMLKSGNYNITECATKCGFNNSSYFCKTYKKYFNKLPKQDIKRK